MELTSYIGAADDKVWRRAKELRRKRLYTEAH